MREIRKLAVAFAAVSTSPAMPQWQHYVEVVRAQRPEVFNAKGAELNERMASLAQGRMLRRRQYALPRLLSALISFVDDHDEEPAWEMFEIPLATKLLTRLQRERALSVDAQLQIAFEEGGCGADVGFDADVGLMEAVLALHTCTRVLARGRDVRLHRDFDLTLADRLRIGQAIAPFDPEDARGGDPLGDTYHYWANVAAGLARPARSLSGRSVRGLFTAGPVLMSNVRERLFGNILFFGNHARIDRLGLSHGVAMQSVSTGDGSTSMGGRS